LILVDANLLIYAYDVSSPRHVAARQWLEEALVGVEPVQFPLQSVLAFVRIGTDPRVFERPLDSTEAIAIVDSWLTRPTARLVTPGDGHWRILADVARAGQARGPRLMDAHLAALAIEHGATLMSADRGFARFPGLRFRNPITA
jgi:toxin-antitoxin system PIN domain toxin